MNILKNCLTVVVLTVIFGNVTVRVVSAEDTQEVIEYLIIATDQSHLMFVRNGKEHTSEEAALHFRKKYQYYKKKIKTPEDFIRLVATKSYFSGREYKVSDSNGTVMPCKDWLLNILKEERMMGIDTFQ